MATNCGVSQTICEATISKGNKTLSSLFMVLLWTPTVTLVLRCYVSQRRKGAQENKKWLKAGCK